ncbi:DUF4765 family protein, partial [Salmonella enterica subsp. enterica serovar Kentucky]|nr:DUF4765 family protein [Salmonella enterica subsp. enterica serovar Kentucky]
KMVQEVVVGLIHEISDIAQSSWLTLEEQHERQAQALESFKENVPLRLQVAVFINKKYNSHLQFNN